MMTWSDGQEGASDALAESIYTELNKLATAHIQRERRTELEPAELVHEAWMRMSRTRGEFPSRQHFFALAALQMRRILIDCARATRAGGRDADPLTLSLRLVDPGPQPAEIATLAAALTQLDQLDKRKSQAFALAELGGFDNQQVANMLHVSLTTIERDLRFARVWLAARLA